MRCMPSIQRPLNYKLLCCRGKLVWLNTILRSVSYRLKGQVLFGEKNLENLLGSISPELIEGDYVFCSVENSSYGDYADAQPIASFSESEGLTLVLLKEAADRFGLTYDGLFRCITLGVHSSLEAVGLTAAISSKLATHGIAANIIAAYFHDHVFVQSELADQAIGILSEAEN